jgi:hypothetical protein
VRRIHAAIGTSLAIEIYRANGKILFAFLVQQKPGPFTDGKGRVCRSN